MNFSGKNVLITGAASGLGKIMARKSLERGAAKLVLWDVNLPGLQQLLIEWPDYAERIIISHVDLSKAEAIKTGTEATLAHVSHIDILINNAGIIVGKFFHEHSPKDITQSMLINTEATMLITAAFLPLMMQQNTGAICNIASSA